MWRQLTSEKIHIALIPVNLRGNPGGTTGGMPERTKNKISFNKYSLVSLL